MEVGSEVWIKDYKTEQAWIPGFVSEKSNDDRTLVYLVSDEDGNVYNFKGDSNNEEIPDLKLRNDFVESAVENLINLPHLHEPAILYSLQIRYNKDEIYTYTGPILIAVNPFKKLQLYTQETLQIYYNSGLLKSQGVDVGNPLPPHVYAIADAAYRDMMNVVHGYGSADKKTKGSQVSANQSILISGESGAGKTESTKIVLKYLTTVGSSNSTSTNFVGSIMDKVLQSNPILEAFGNAKTLRNDNSSRFGKFIELEFSRRGVLIGGSISTYLLEKVRLPWQQYGERNFHIFYQLTSGANEEEKAKWGLKSIRDYEYTTKGAVFTLEGIDDALEFKELKHAMDILNFSQADQSSMFDLVAGILHLGQLRFQSTADSEGEGSKVLDEPDCLKSLNSFSSLCGLPVADIVSTLTVRVIQTRGEIYMKKLTAIQASDACDAVAKAIYGKLFDWIVETINRSIQVDNADVRATIGVLDIFGFECFTSNSFEQLCINYTNETLQQQFNQYIFKLEQQEYQREKIEWSFIEFPDNKDCLELIEHKINGILAMLDDECRLPASSDEKFAGRMYKAYSDNPRFSANPAQKRNFKFCVHHYAGPVEYSTMTFVDKNKDELPKEAAALLSTSTVSLLRSLFDTTGAKSAEKTQSSKHQQPKTSGAISTLNSVGIQFKEQLHRLMENIYATSPHYIRCLKPNDKNVRDNFNRLRITEQLRYGGVLEAVRVARSGFPVRLVHGEFFARYRMLLSVQCLKSTLPRFITSQNVSFRDLCEQFLTELWQFYFEETTRSPSIKSSKYSKIGFGKKTVSRHNVQVGLTKIFLRKEAHDILESLRFKVVYIAATQLQASYRRFLVRSKYVCMVIATQLLQRVIRGMFSRSKARSIRHYRSAMCIQAWVWRYLAEQRYQRFKYALIKLQASFRTGQCVKAYAALRKWIAAVRLQTFSRMRHLRRNYLLYRHALVILQNRFRKLMAIKLLKKLKIEAKDLGKLKQSNETLKKEIDEIKLKAAQERERLREEAEQRAKEIAEKMKKEEEEKTKLMLAVLQAKLEEEQRMREEAEIKLKEIPRPIVNVQEVLVPCQNCEDTTSRYQDALKKILELEQLLENERAEIRQKERQFLKEQNFRAPVARRSSAVEAAPKPLGIAFIPVKEPTLSSASTQVTTNLVSETSSIPSPEVQQEFNKLRHANHVLEQEVSRLRRLSLEQQTLLESRSRSHSRDLSHIAPTPPAAPSSDSPHVPQNLPTRRASGGANQANLPHTGVRIEVPSRRNSSAPQNEIANKSPHWNQAWDSEDESSESESTTDQQSTQSEVLATAAVTQAYEKNLEVWKNEFYSGFKVKYWEAPNFSNYDMVVKLEKSSQTLNFTTQRRGISSLLAAKNPMSLLLSHVKDCLPGSNVATNAMDQNLMLTIIALTENNNPREISIKFQTREERNSVLDKMRALVTATNFTVNPLRRGSGNQPVRRGSQLAQDHSQRKPQIVEPSVEKEKFAARASRRLSKRELVLEENLSINQPKESSPAIPSQVHPFEETKAPDAEYRELHHQMKDLHQQNDKLKYQLMMMSNELGERNSLIDDMKKMQAQYEQKLLEKDNLYRQDSIVRLQLGKRLEQVLMDKAEAEEKIELLQEKIRNFMSGIER